MNKITFQQLKNIIWSTFLVLQEGHMAGGGGLHKERDTLRTNQMLTCAIADEACIQEPTNAFDEPGSHQRFVEHHRRTTE